ncbi:MAG TPA: TIR domain-containing protein, partial [Archangium sp.]|nr:TIR domain-containing protein [Archangium sp.]
MFHVFLSHSSADKPAVEQLALRLREAGLQPFLDKWHLVPGAPWQPALEQALAESETTAVFFGPSGSGPWRNEELQLALVRAAQQRDDFRVIPVLLPGARPEQLSGFLGLRTWVDFREGLDSEAAFARLVAGIQGRAPSGDAFTLPDEPAPYRGLLAFDEAHAEYFFGRGADIERTVEKLGRERFVAVVGPSGCGKSSLVLGGVLPHVKRPGGLLGSGGRTWTMRPGDRPLRALADAIAAGEASGAQRLSLSDSLHQRFLAHPDGLRTALATLTADSPGPCVLVVDQLEELFTHAPGHGGAGEVAPFVANLRQATLDGGGSLRILATLRADFFDRCLGLASLRELLQDRLLLLGSLGDEALREVILRPAQKVGASLEKGLLTTILRDVSREPGALPLLEDALDQLWRARTGAWLTQTAYEASGGISQALQRRAQACYEALRPEEREVARLLLVRLTSLGEGREDTRRRVPRSELVFPGIPEERVEHVLRALSGPGARLIVVDQGSVEVAHEILIRTWSTLRKWLDEDRRELRVQRRLAEAAGEWNEKGRQAGYLYTGARLLDAEELFQHKPSLINQLERQFLEASIQLREQQRREEEEQAKRELEAARRLAEETEARRRSEAEGAAAARRANSRLRRLALGLLVASVALVAGSFGLYRQFQRAEKEKRVAFSRELVLSARQGLREDPQRSLLLLQEAQRLAPVETLGEQLDAWSLEPGLLVLWDQAGIGIINAWFSPDGARVLTASYDGTARLWEADSGKPLARFLGHHRAVESATFSPDGARVLTASQDGTARLWEADSGKP